MPSRGYFLLPNDGESVQDYRLACEKLIGESIEPLLVAPEPLKDFYQRRLAILEAFVGGKGQNHRAIT
jgi:hypothetical protein